ncbi:hypothetical protein F8M41_016740 [Gigaspora margarita]|uniref:Uncharacterized protein n=1 Tax=Gigaspora margarita TaxID=4874 RepID=A0A8H3ZZR9_GIGMA|nr:hypothetical protein F8M41_016740 [Gigaspora margarita]
MNQEYFYIYQVVDSLESGQSGQRCYAIELPCAIASLVSLYDDSGLLEYKTEERQTKRHVDNFLKRILLDSNYAEISKNRQNKQKQTHIEHADIENNTCEIGIQTDNKETSEIGVQTFDNMSHTFESYIHLLEAQLNIKINEIEDLKKQIEHKNYVSEIHLAITGIKYSIARSKTIIDIDNHVISSGSYTKFVNWLESLAVENEPLSKGLLFLAFDNEQREQHNYLNRGNNTVIYHIVTSFLALNMNKNDYTQFTITPWLCDSLTDNQYDKLYYVIPKMQAEHELELKIYLSSIIEELVAKKNENFNTIDQVVKNQKVLEVNLNATLRAEFANEFASINTAFQSKPLVIRSHIFVQEQNSPNINRISITQQLNSKHNIVISEMYVPDPLEFNPNSIENVKKTFTYFQAVINFCIGIRNNRLLLVSAAQRIFAPIWSGRRHPMYRLLEITYEEQLMRLNPEIKKHIELYSVISRSGYSNQHQGLDAILEEINKYLKALILPIPSQKYWRMQHVIV